MELGASIAIAMLASAELAEVLRSLGDYIIIEFEINSTPILFCRAVSGMFALDRRGLGAEIRLRYGKMQR